MVFASLSLLATSIVLSLGYTSVVARVTHLMTRSVATLWYVVLVVRVSGVPCVPLTLIMPSVQVYCDGRYMPLFCQHVLPLHNFYPKSSVKLKSDSLPL